MINTSALTGVADSMATALGFPGYRYAIVAHPISSLTQDGVAALATVAAPQVLALLRGQIDSSTAADDAGATDDRG